MVSKLTKEDYAIAGKELGIDPAVVATIASVEAGYRRSGFGSDGRVLILWERHVCYRNATRQQRAALPRSVCNKRRGGYAKSNATNWWRLERARQVIGDKAYLCASYGLFQIMGFNHAAAGYKTAREMAEAFAIGEREQLLGFVRFIKSNPSMIRAIRKKDWATFARLYNGKGYKKNKYDTKMARAYARYSKIAWPDVSTPIEVAASAMPVIEGVATVANRKRVAGGVAAAFAGLATALYYLFDELAKWFVEVWNAVLNSF